MCSKMAPVLKLRVLCQMPVYAHLAGSVVVAAARTWLGGAQTGHLNTGSEEREGGGATLMWLPGSLVKDHWS